MKIRPLAPEDIPVLKELHRKAGYGFKFPEMSGMESAHVLEDDGQIVGFVGAEKTVQVFAIFDPAWASPHRRIAAITSMASAMDGDLIKKGYRTQHCWIDPQWPRLAEHLIKRLRCRLALWPCLFRNLREGRD